MTKKVVKKATKKVPAKKVAVKVAPKEVVKKEVVKQREIKAQMVAKNFICMIDGNKKVLKNPTEAQIKTLTNKVKLYNKKNTDALLEEIILLVDVTVAIEETKKATTKGLEKILKKEKKTTKTKETIIAPVLTLAEQIKAKLASNDLSEQERKELRALLKEEKEEEANAPTTQQTTNTYSGER
jgi:uncharacterized membrane protein